MEMNVLDIKQTNELISKEAEQEELALDEIYINEEPSDFELDCDEKAVNEALGISVDQQLIDIGANDGLKRHFIEISKYPLLSPKEEANLFFKLSEGNEEAREKIILCNGRLVFSVAKLFLNKFKNCPLSYEDLIQEGQIGLLTAVRKFDVTKGFKFSTYAYHWINQAMRRGVDNSGYVIRLPVHVREKMNIYNRTLQKLKTEGVSTPTDDEIVDFSDGKLTLKDIDMCNKYSYSYSSLDSAVGNDDSDGSTYSEIIADPNENLIQDINLQNESDYMFDLISKLTDREKTILMYRYGIGCEREYTLDEVGKMLGVTRERVRQIQCSATKKLKKILLEEIATKELKGRSKTTSKETKNQVNKNKKSCTLKHKNVKTH